MDGLRVGGPGLGSGGSRVWWVWGSGSGVCVGGPCWVFGVSTGFFTVQVWVGPGVLVGGLGWGLGPVGPNGRPRIGAQQAPTLLVIFISS